MEIFEAFSRKNPQVRQAPSIAAVLTALGDMIPGLFLNIECMEPKTPEGIKILLRDLQKRVDDLSKFVGGNFRQT